MCFSPIPSVLRPLDPILEKNRFFVIFGFLFVGYGYLAIEYRPIGITFGKSMIISLSHSKYRS